MYGRRTSGLKTLTEALDRHVSVIADNDRWWVVIAAAAIAMSLLAHTPPASLFRQMTIGWSAAVARAQIEHPLTPFDPHTFRQELRPSPGEITHGDKLTFRLTIPLVGRALHTGAATALLLNWIAGLAFFPMFAMLAERLLGDRIDAAYLTFAMSLTWAGGWIFNDNRLGDGLAWTLLLAAVFFECAPVIVLAVLAAAFVDERALIASSAVMLFWWQRRPSLATAVVAAWVAYGILRMYLAFGLGLRTGMVGMFSGQTMWENLAHSIPYVLLATLQGLWIWPLLAIAAYYSRGQRWKLIAFIGALGTVLAVACIVQDFNRSVGYAVIFLPLAWQERDLDADEQRRIARACAIAGLLLIVPFNTPLRWLYHIYGGPVLAGFG